MLFDDTKGLNKVEEAVARTDNSKQDGYVSLKQLGTPEFLWSSNVPSVAQTSRTPDLQTLAETCRWLAQAGELNNSSKRDPTQISGGPASDGLSVAVRSRGNAAMLRARCDPTRAWARFRSVMICLCLL